MWKQQRRTLSAFVSPNNESHLSPPRFRSAASKLTKFSNLSETVKAKGDKVTLD